MPLNFTLVESNPNDTTGGGGSLAGPSRDVDARGPWFVWPNQEYDSGASPYAVVAASEVEAMYAALHNGTEVIAGAEHRDVSAEARARSEARLYAAQVTGQGDGDPENEVDFNDPESFARAFGRQE